MFYILECNSVCVSACVCLCVRASFDHITVCIPQGHGSIYRLVTGLHGGDLMGPCTVHSHPARIILLSSDAVRCTVGTVSESIPVV